MNLTNCGCEIKPELWAIGCRREKAEVFRNRGRSSSQNPSSGQGGHARKMDLLKGGGLVWCVNLRAFFRHWGEELVRAGFSLDIWNIRHSLFNVAFICLCVHLKNNGYTSIAWWAWSQVLGDTGELVCCASASKGHSPVGDMCLANNTYVKFLDCYLCPFCLLWQKTAVGGAYNKRHLFSPSLGGWDWGVGRAGSTWGLLRPQTRGLGSCRWLECSSSQTFHSQKRRPAWRHEVTCSSLHRSHGRVRPKPGGLQGHLTPPWDGGSSLSSPPLPHPPKALPAVLLCSSHKATPGALEVRLPALAVVDDSLPRFLEVRWKCGSSSPGIQGLFTHHRTFACCLTLMDANLF